MAALLQPSKFALGTLMFEATDRGIQVSNSEGEKGYTLGSNYYNQFHVYPNFARTFGRTSSPQSSLQGRVTESRAIQGPLGAFTIEITDVARQFRIVPKDQAAAPRPAARAPNNLYSPSPAPSQPARPTYQGFGDFG